MNDSTWLRHNSDHPDPLGAALMTGSVIWQYDGSQGTVFGCSSTMDLNLTFFACWESVWVARQEKQEELLKPLTVWLFSMNCTALSFTSFLTLLYVKAKEGGQGKRGANQESLTQHETF